MSKSGEFEEYVAQNPHRFIGWYNDECTQKFLTFIEGSAEDWQNILSNREKIDPDDVPNMNRILASIQILKSLKRKVDGIFEELTAPPEEEDEYGEYGS